MTPEQRDILKLNQKVALLTSSVIQLMSAVSSLRSVTQLIVAQGHAITRMPEQQEAKKTFSDIGNKIDQLIETLQRVIDVDTTDGQQ